MRDDQIERHLKTTETIVRSPLVHEFLIGLSSWSATRKASSYYRMGFEHFVTIAAPLTPRNALKLERYLFKRCTQGDRRSPLYQKYHHEKRDGPYRASLGGQSHTVKTPMLVYMVWRNKCKGAK
ncbi:MAG: hypothetical protein AB7T07_15505 [Steroidobacteraceae bacterium]